jgi:hypothetical protein
VTSCVTENVFVFFFFEQIRIFEASDDDTVASSHCKRECVSFGWVRDGRLLRVGEGENVTGALERLLFLLSRGFVSVSVCSFEQKKCLPLFHH